MRLTRRERIKLLLKTYIDATSPGRGDSDVRSALGTRPPARATFYDDGSYHELARCVSRLRTDYPRIHRHCMTVYAPDWLERECGFTVPHPRRQLQERGLDFLERWMPANVYVPSEIVENGGFTPGEAKIAAKRRRVAA